VHMPTYLRKRMAEMVELMQEGVKEAVGVWQPTTCHEVTQDSLGSFGIWNQR
jgi:hypothetical protein